MLLAKPRQAFQNRAGCVFVGRVDSEVKHELPVVVRRKRTVARALNLEADFHGQSPQIFTSSNDWAVRRREFANSLTNPQWNRSSQNRRERGGRGGKTSVHRKISGQGTILIPLRTTRGGFSGFLEIGGRFQKRTAFPPAFRGGQVQQSFCEVLCFGSPARKAAAGSSAVMLTSFICGTSQPCTENGRDCRSVGRACWLVGIFASPASSIGRSG